MRGGCLLVVGPRDLVLVSGRQCVVAGVERTLWTLTDPAFVPQVPLPLMFNLWHPPTHWLPTRAPADYPAHDGVMLVDRATWTSP